MRLETKVQIARATLSLLTLLAAMTLLGVLVLVLCVGLQINPFRETTTSFLGATFMGVIGVSAILVLVNVATNVSLIADAKIADLKVESRTGTLKKWGVAFVAAAILLAGVVFGGTYFSKKKYLAVVHAQAEEVLKANSGLLDEVSQHLASGKSEDYRRILDIREFLANQRTDLPQLSIIYSGTFEGRMTFHQINGYIPYDQRTDVYTPAYFVCTKNLDCEYLTKFFSGQKADILEKYTVRDDLFYIYIPIEGKESRFVLLFDRRNSYGKIGS